MGVDYGGYYGLGYKITVPELEENHEFYEDVGRYIDNAIEEANYSYFQIGDSSYTKTGNEYYIILCDPFKDGNLDVTQKAKDLKEYILSKGIIVEGEFDVVGGLHVY
jgi:hypothetical protein